MCVSVHFKHCWQFDCLFYFLCALKINLKAFVPVEFAKTKESAQQYLVKTISAVAPYFG